VEKIFQLVFEDHATRLKLNNISINNLRYADDMAIMDENIQELQITLNAINGKEAI